MLCWLEQILTQFRSVAPRWSTLQVSSHDIISGTGFSRSSVYQYDQKLLFSVTSGYWVFVYSFRVLTRLTDGTQLWTSDTLKNDRGKKMKIKWVVTDPSTWGKERHLSECSQASSARPSGDGGGGCSNMKIKMYEKYVRMVIAAPWNKCSEILISHSG